MNGPRKRSAAKAAAIPALLIGLALVLHLLRKTPVEPGRSASPAVASTTLPAPSGPVPGDALLERYGDPALPPMEDVRAIHQVMGGYFSVIKDASRYPIGGNADLAAALRGENANREVFVRHDSRVFNAEGLLIDRWGTPLVVHPEGWRRIELRSAGPDQTPYTGDDLILSPTGIATRP